MAPSNPSVFLPSQLHREMQGAWQTMLAVTLGTDYIRQGASIYLPREPKEPDDAWKSRIERSVLTPYTSRLIENAAGMVLRRLIHVEGDDYWDDFCQDVDGMGSSINEYAKQILVAALEQGHSLTLVDYPSEDAGPSAYSERLQGRRPYFVPYRAHHALGWGLAGRLPYSPLAYIRLIEKVQEAVEGTGYDEKLTEQVRVITPGRYAVYRDSRGEPETGTFDLDEIPVVPLYTNKTAPYVSTPLLLDIAHINIAHYRLQADLFHALHLAAMKKLVLEGVEKDDDVSLGVNYAIGMTPGNKAYWINCDASSFEAQANEIQRLEEQMSSLGIMKLLGQKFVAEAADAKRVDQSQANSVMSIISIGLENCLNRCFRLAAKYLGIDPPEITVDRDFDFYRMLGQDVSVIGQLAKDGMLQPETYLQILRKGEILPDTVDLDEEVAYVQEQIRRREEMLQQASQLTPANPPLKGPQGGPNPAGAQSPSKPAAPRLLPRPVRPAPPADTED